MKSLKRMWRKWRADKPSFDLEAERKAEAYYVIRYLEPKQVGFGEIAFSFSTDAEKPKLKDLRKQFPHVFRPPGFYSLMKATAQTMTVEKQK